MTAFRWRVKRGISREIRLATQGLVLQSGWLRLVALDVRMGTSQTKGQ